MDAVDTGAYRQAQDSFDGVLTAVAASGQWDRPSACAGWTVRDVVGHMIWGQELVRHIAAGQEYTSQVGGRGAKHPGSLVGEDPLAEWRVARAASTAALTDEALKRPGPARFVAVHPEATLGHFLNVMVLEALVHAWDIGYPLGIGVRLPPDLVTASFAAAEEIVVRAPGMFAPAVTPPPDADEQTRWLAFLGRST